MNEQVKKIMRRLLDLGDRISDALVPAPTQQPEPIPVRRPPARQRSRR